MEVKARHPILVTLPGHDKIAGWQPPHPPCSIVGSSDNEGLLGVDYHTAKIATSNLFIVHMNTRTPLLQFQGPQVMLERIVKPRVQMRWLLTCSQTYYGLGRCSSTYNLGHLWLISVPHERGWSYRQKSRDLASTLVSWSSSRTWVLCKSATKDYPLWTTLPSPPEEKHCKCRYLTNIIFNCMKSNQGLVLSFNVARSTMVRSLSLSKAISALAFTACSYFFFSCSSKPSYFPKWVRNLYAFHAKHIEYDGDSNVIDSRYS